MAPITLHTNTIVMLPGYAPYPRYGRVVDVSGEQISVTNVQCGDPRCAAEHQHGNQTWYAADVCAAENYQPRAPWEHGRKSSPNTPL